MKAIVIIFIVAFWLMLDLAYPVSNKVFVLAEDKKRLDELENLIADGVSIDTKNSNGWTPLMAAAARGNLAAVELLLAAGADPSAASRTKYYSGFTALMAAVYFGRPGVVLALVDAGADLNAVDNHYYGETALMLAVKGGNLEIVSALLTGGADANAVNRRGVTALMYAASYGRVDVVKMLLAVGADPGIRDHAGLDASRWSFLAGSRRAEVRGLLETE